MIKKLNRVIPLQMGVIFEKIKNIWKDHWGKILQNANWSQKVQKPYNQETFVTRAKNLSYLDN